MVVRYGTRRTSHRLRLLRHTHLKTKKKTHNLKSKTVESSIVADAERCVGSPSSKERFDTGGSSEEFSETALRNIALEAVRTGNYYAAPEEQAEVLLYIADVYKDLLADQKFLKKNSAKLKVENGLTSRYTVAEILAKHHERDGYNVFLDPEEACAVASIAKKEAANKTPIESVTVGKMLVAGRNVRIFASTSSWQQIGMLSVGQRVEVAELPQVVEGFEMVAIRPEGAIELKHMEVVKDVVDSVAAVLATEHTRGGDETALGRLAELQEGLDAAIDAEDDSSDPVGVDELLELLEGCASLGELGAIVYCAERIEALHCDDSVVNLPNAVLDRMFQALKPLLRPGSGKQKPDLHGPWSQPPPGRVGMPNPRKKLGQLVNKLATLRKERQLADAGEEVQQERLQLAKTDEMLQKMAAALSKFLFKDSAARACRRRGPLGEAVVRVCSSHGLAVSSALAFVIIGELENSGVVKSQGRELEFNMELSLKSNGESLSAFKPDIGLLEDFAKERLNRRRKRQQARDKTRLAKRRCAEEDA